MSRDVPRPAVPFTLVWIAGIALGVVALLYGQCDVRDYLDRQAKWLPSGEGFVETDLVGTLLAAPETDAEGDTVLHLDADGVRVRLRVYASVTGGALPDDLLRGDRLRLWCRIGVPTAYRNPGYQPATIGMYARGLDAIGSVKSPRLVRRIRAGEPTPGRRLDRLRVALRARLDRIAHGRERAVLGAMLLGDRAGLTPADNRIVRRAGLAHVLAISGMHVSIVLAVIAAGLHLVPVPRSTRTILLVVLLGGGAFLAGVRPSILRAAIGAGVALAGRWIGRDGDSINSLALVAAALLIIHPGWVLDVGFQLSFVATAGILVLVPRWSDRVPGVVAVSAAAYAATAPLVAWHFRSLAPIALLANLVAVPICGLVLVAGLAALALCGLPILGPSSGWLASHAAGWLLDCAEWSAGMPGAAMTVPRPGVWVMLAWYAALFGPARIPMALPILAIWLHLGPPPTNPPGVEVRMIDVGQGQSILVRGPSGGTVLIDAGGSASKRFDVGERVVVPVLADLGVRRLDAVVVTHRDIDHAGGVYAVRRAFEVGEVWDERTRRRGARVRYGTLRIRLLHPGPADHDLSRNDRSLVVGVDTPCGAVVVPGDLETPGEEHVLAAGQSPRGSLLIVGHHGASDATSERFLDAVAPVHAGISAGRNNRFGHPDPSVLTRLAARGVNVRRTDLDGQVVWTCIGGPWQTETSAGDQ